MFGKPSYDEIVAYAKKRGWYTPDNHPPLPFLALCADDPEKMDNTASDEAPWDCTKCSLQVVTRVNTKYDMERLKLTGVFSVFFFAKPYTGPINGIMGQMNMVPARIEEIARPGLLT